MGRCCRGIFRRQHSGNREVILIPIGKTNSFLLRDLRSRLQSELGVRVTLSAESIPLSGSVKQLAASDILQTIYNRYSKNFGPNVRYMGITDVDIYLPGMNYVYDTYVENFVGAMSYRRFTGKFNRSDSNRPRLLDRTFKQAVTTLFKVWGIPQCSTSFCIRANSRDTQELDKKNDPLCEYCRKKWKELKEMQATSDPKAPA